MGERRDRSSTPTEYEHRESVDTKNLNLNSVTDIYAFKREI